MIAEELINQMIPPLKTSDSAAKAIKWMEEFRINQLAVIEDNIYKGLISEDIILDSGNLDQPLSEFKLFNSDQFVSAHTHFYDVIKLAIKNKLQVVPVLNGNKEYMGVISVNDT